MRSAQRMGSTASENGENAASSVRPTTKDAFEAVSVVGVRDLAAAIDACGVARVILLCPDTPVAGRRIARLARLLSETLTAVAAIELTAGTRLASAMGCQDNGASMAALLGGQTMIDRTILADPHSAAHLVGSGGFEFGDTEPETACYVRLLLTAFCEVYRTILVLVGAEHVETISDLLTEDSAVVVVRSSNEERLVEEETVAILNKSGIEDILLLDNISR